jgi:predicted AlkP superfamily phosphohydrolase/phosphomutase
MKEVLHRSEIYQEGPYFDAIPDLLFQASEHVTVNPYLSTNIFETIPPGERSGRGRHVYSRDGVVFGAGSAVESERGIEADIMDVTPTILHLFGLPVAETMTGSIITDICPDDHRNVEVDTYVDESKITQIEEDEKKEMEDWLEDMGYI